MVASLRAGAPAPNQRKVARTVGAWMGRRYLRTPPGPPDAWLLSRPANFERTCIIAARPEMSEGFLEMTTPGNSLLVAPPSDVIGKFVSWFCDILAVDFTGDRLQLMWEGYAWYRMSIRLLDAGCRLEFGETGGNNTNGVLLRRHPADQHRTERHDVTGLTKDSADLVVSSVGVTSVGWRLQVKTFPQTGRKRGRAAVEAFGKDLKYVDNRTPGRVAFVFLADIESYDGLRGIRRAAQGPPIQTSHPLPEVTTQTLDGQVDGRSATFRRIRSAEGFDRVIGGIWRES